jgi:mitochondrial fission protein ELM1
MICLSPVSYAKLVTNTAKPVTILASASYTGKPVTILASGGYTGKLKLQCNNINIYFKVVGELIFATHRDE